MRLLKAAAGMAAFVGAILAGTAADATVTYTFTADSAYFGHAYGSFEITLPNYVTALTEVPSLAVTSCSITSPATGFLCGDSQSFDVWTGIGDVIGFRSKAEGSSQGWDTEVYYRFDEGAFATDGVHESIFFGADQHAFLTVSSSAVPEPATWALMVVGVGLVGAMQRRRRVSFAM